MTMIEDEPHPLSSQAVLPSLSLERMAEIVNGKQPALDIESRAMAAEVMRLQAVIEDRARLRDSMSVISCIATVQAPDAVLVNAIQAEALSHFTDTSRGTSPMPTTLDAVLQGGFKRGEIALIMGNTGGIRGRALERVRVAEEAVASGGGVPLPDEHVPFVKTMLEKANKP